MLSWFAENYVNILLVLAIVAMVFFLIRSLIRDKKAGRSSCGGNCASCGACSACAMGGACHGATGSRKTAV